MSFFRFFELGRCNRGDSCTFSHPARAPPPVPAPVSSEEGDAAVDILSRYSMSKVAESLGQEAQLRSKHLQ